MCRYVYRQTYLSLYVHAYINVCIYVCTYADMYIYVAGMNMNAMGMSVHPFQWNFYVLAGKYLHYLIFDDVITLHH